MELICYK